MTTPETKVGEFKGVGLPNMDSDEAKKNYSKVERGFLATWVLAVVFLIMFTIVALLAGTYLATHATGCANLSEEHAKRVGYGTVVLAVLNFVVTGAALAYYFWIAMWVDERVRGKRVKTPMARATTPETPTTTRTTG